MKPPGSPEPVIERLRRSPHANWILAGCTNSGKSTLLQRVVEQSKLVRPSWRVGGLVSPGLFLGSRKIAYIGFDCLGDSSFLLAKRSAVPAEGRKRMVEMFGTASQSRAGQRIGPWLVLEEGLTRANEAIRRAIRLPSDLVVVDEFGPLECEGKGLREGVDAALGSGIPVLLVVRRGLIEQVQRLYGAFEVIEV